MTMKTLTTEELLAFRDAEGETRVIDLGEGKCVRIKALSLDEHLKIVADCRRSGEWDEIRWNTLVLHYGLVEPKLSVDDAAKVCKKPAGLVYAIIHEILDLSGLSSVATLSASAVEEDEEFFREE